MAQASFPFEGIDTTETQFSKWARNFNNGVDDEPTGPALQVSAGSGLAVDVAVGEAMVRGHYYISDAVETLTLATADPTDDRIDLVVLKLDPTANSITLAVKTGTPAGSPSAPSLVQTDAGIYEQPLAEVEVVAASGVPGTITDRREFMGTRLGSWSTAGRPTPAGRVLFGFNTDTETIEFYNTVSAAWQDVTPASIGDIGDVTVTSASDGDLLAYDSGTSEWINQALQSAQLPNGSILQIVRATDTTRRSTSSVSLVDVTGMAVTITPQSSSSQILILSIYNAYTDTPNVGNQYARFSITDSSNNAISGAEESLFGSRNIANTASGDIKVTSVQTMLAFDTPATTSAVTYKLRFRTESASSTIEVFNDIMSGQMYAIEVAA